MMDIQTLAEQFGVSPAMLQEYADYIIRKAKENPEAFAADPDNFVGRAVRHYNQQALAYFSEVLNNPIKFNELAEQVESHLKPMAPETDSAAALYLLSGLARAGWNAYAYDDGDGQWEPETDISKLVEAVLAVDCMVEIRLQHNDGTNGAIVLLAQGSPEDLLVDHTWKPELTEDIDRLTAVYDMRAE